MKILLVTDDLATLAEVIGALENRGHAVLSAVDSDVAVKLMEKNRDIQVLLFLHFSDELETVKAVHASYRLIRGTNRIIITKQKLSHDARDALSGLCAFLESAAEFLEWLPLSDIPKK